MTSQAYVTTIRATSFLYQNALIGFRVTTTNGQQLTRFVVFNHLLLFICSLKEQPKLNDKQQWMATTSFR